MVRVVVLDSKGREGVRYINPALVMYVAEGGPGFCFLQMAGLAAADWTKVLGPASDVAKRLSAPKPQAQAVA